MITVFFKITRLACSNVFKGSILFKGLIRSSLFSFGVEYKRFVLGAFMFFPCLVVANPCKDQFKNQKSSLFQKSPEAIHQVPSYIENLKTILLEDPATRLSEKQVAVQLLGALGESQKDFSQEVLDILIKAMHKYKKKDDLSILVVETSELIGLKFDFTKDVLIKELFIYINDRTSPSLAIFPSIRALRQLAKKWPENAVSISKQLLKSRLIPQQKLSFLKVVNKVIPSLDFIRDIKAALVEIILESSPDIQKQLIQLLQYIHVDSDSSKELQDVVIEIYGEVTAVKLRKDISPLRSLQLVN